MRRLLAALVLTAAFAPSAFADDEVEVNIQGNGAMNVRAGGVHVTVDPGSAPSPAPLPAPRPPPGRPVGRVEQGQRVEIDGNDRKVEQECSPGMEVLVGGNDNKVRLRGDCHKVDVSGNGNQVKVDGVSVVEISGNDNSVRYRHGLRRGEPRVNQSGNDNKVSQRGHGRGEDD